MSSTEQLDSILQYARFVGLLKQQKRMGWVLRGVPEAESVADHSYRMAMLAMSLGPLIGCLDMQKCVLMALVHDLGEALVGDLTPQDNVGKADKLRMEEEAMQKITKVLPEVSKGLVKGLWEEYEERKSEEATFVKDLDILDLVMQASEYEELYHDKDLSEFFQGARVKLRHKLSLDLFDRLVLLRGDSKAS